MASEPALKQAELALRSLALSDRPFVQRLEAACVDLGILVADDVPEAHRPLFHAIEQTAMARGRLESTLAAMAEPDRLALAGRVYEFCLGVLRDGVG